MTEDQTQQNPARLLGSRFAMLLGLTGLAISQPLLNVLANSAEVFTFYHFESRDIVVFALTLALVPPVFLWLIETVAHLANQSLGRLFHLAICGVLFGLFVQQVIVSTGLDVTLLAWAASVAAGALLVVALLRWQVVSSWLALVGILPLLSVGLFLFSSPVADLVNPPDRAEAIPAQQLEGEEPPASVIFILFDELPTQSVMNADEKIDAPRFPNFAKFADDATWYRHATTVHPFTDAAVPAILTGVYPSADEKRANWIDHPDNLFRLLGDSHHLTVSESLTNLCGLDECTSAPQPPPSDQTSTGTSNEIEPDVDADFDAMWEVTGDVFEERISPSSDDEPLDDFEEAVEVADTSPEFEADVVERSEKQPLRLTEFIDAMAPSPKPTLYFLHLVLPHQPWRYEGNGVEYRVPSGPAAPALPIRSDGVPALEEGEQWYPDTLRQRHLLQASYSDVLLGQILDKAKAEKIYDDSLVIVMADHGVAFDPGHPFREYAHETRDAIAYSPLLIKSPHQSTGSVSDTNAMTIDVLPTIAAELGVTVPWEVDGVDLDSNEFASRGSTKTMYDWVQKPQEGLREIVEFDDADAYQELLAGLFPPLGDVDDPLSGLWATSEAAPLVGRRVSTLSSSGDAAIEVEVGDEDDLSDPGDATPLGYIAGFVADSDVEKIGDGVMAVAVDDKIVAISEVQTKGGRPGWFGTPLPTQHFAPVDLDLYVVDPTTQTVTGTIWVE